MTELSDEFFQRLKQLRKLHRVTQEQMTAQLGISYSGYRRYESGEREMPLSIAVKLADLYGIALDELVGRMPPCQ